MKIKIKVKGIGQNIDKRTIKKILKDENTLVICKDFLTDDYMTDLQDNFKNSKFENNNKIRAIKGSFLFPQYLICLYILFFSLYSLLCKKLHVN